MATASTTAPHFNNRTAFNPMAWISLDNAAHEQTKIAARRMPGRGLSPLGQAQIVGTVLLPLRGGQGGLAVPTANATSS